MSENLDELKDAIAAQSELVRILKADVDAALDPFSAWPCPEKFIPAQLIRSAIRVLGRENPRGFTAKEAHQIPAMIFSQLRDYDWDSGAERAGC